MAAAVFRSKGTTYTCLRVTETPKAVHFITMASLQLEKTDPRTFYLEWEEFTNYPVRRAAEVYLGAGEYREIAPQVREHLERIVADPATDYDPARINQPKETDMNAPAKQPATSKTGTNKASAAPAKTKVAGSTTPAKTAAPAKQAVPAKTTPAKTVPAKTAPAKTAAKKAPNGMDTVLKQATAKTAPAKQAAPTKAAPVARTAPNSDQKLKVAEPDKPRRGTTGEFVEEALKLKTFTRQQLHDAMVKKGYESKPARIKIADCVYFKVFVEA